MKSPLLSYMLLRAILLVQSSEVPSPSTHAGADITPSNIDFSQKHESLLTCSSFDLEPDEYVLFPNGTVYVEAYNRTYTEQHYVLEGDLLSVCVPEELVEEERQSSLVSTPMKYLTEAGLGVSMVFLLVHLVVFAMVPDLQNLPGCNLASLCASLFLSYLLMMVSKSDAVAANSIACVTSAVLTQFFFLGSFLWMFVMAFDVFRSVLRATIRLRLATKAFKAKKYFYNCLLSWGIPLAFSTAALAVDHIETSIPVPYRPHFHVGCWFKSKQSLLTFFAGPVFTLISLNFLLFGISAFSIFCNRMRANQDNRSSLKKNHLLYFRLAVIMGVTWVTGALAPVVNALWLWYLFAVLNTLQGFFIFAAFTCTKKVRKHFRGKLFGGRRPSEQTLAPTFQSYCFFASSIEKDLDKVMDSKEAALPANAVVVHL